MIHTRIQLAIFTRSGRRSRNPIKLHWRFAGGWVSVVIDITLLVEEHDQQPRPKNGATPLHLCVVAETRPDRNLQTERDILYTRLKLLASKTIAYETRYVYCVMKQRRPILLLVLQSLGLGFISTIVEKYSAEPDMMYVNKNHMQSVRDSSLQRVYS